MLTAIRVGPSKALRLTTLYKLGQINVFCGKNNSGKSTLLEAIGAVNREDGLAVDGETIATMTTLFGGAWQHFHGADRTSWDKMFATVGAAHVESAWFLSDKSTFMQTLRDCISEGNGVSSPWNQEHVANSYRTLFPQQVSCVRIPETRHLQLESPISERHAVSADGTGLLNYLFYAKNQLSGEQPHRIYREIERAFTQLSEGFSFDVVMPHDALPDEGSSARLYFSKNGRDWMPARDCGFGLQELLLILYFAIEPHVAIVCIEEPETHMHPEMQRKLAAFLHTETAKQYFISTHSSVFLRPAVADRVFTVTLKDDGICVADATSRAQVLSELGFDVADNIVSDVLILTEGPTDIAVFEELLRKRGLLEKYRIRLFPLGGDNMARVDLSPLTEHAHAIAVVDGDPDSESARVKLLRECARLDIPAVRLERRSIENYFTVDALRSVFGPQMRADVRSIDPDIPVKDQIGIDPKKKGWNVAHAMALTDIDGTDLEAFLDSVEALCHAIS